MKEKLIEQFKSWVASADSSLLDYPNGTCETRVIHKDKRFAISVEKPVTTDSYPIYSIFRVALSKNTPYAAYAIDEKITLTPEEYKLCSDAFSNRMIELRNNKINENNKTRLSKLKKIFGEFPED